MKTANKDNPIYVNAYKKYYIESQILNSTGHEIPSIHTVLYDKRNVEAAIFSLTGDADGMIKSSYGYEIPALIPNLKQELQKIDKDFKDLNQNRWNQGRSPLKEMPPDLLLKKLDIQAALAVSQKELQTLKNREKEYTDIKKNEDDRKLLQYGLVCFSRNHGTGAADPDMMNVLAEIDGQVVGQKNGLLIIEDNRSPYNGMSVIDYRKLAKEYTTKKQAVYYDLYKAHEQQMKLKGFSTIEVPGFGMHTVSRADLPPFPEWAVNHLTKNPDK